MPAPVYYPQSSGEHPAMNTYTQGTWQTGSSTGGLHHGSPSSYGLSSTFSAFSPYQLEDVHETPIEEHSQAGYLGEDLSLAHQQPADDNDYDDDDNDTTDEDKARVGSFTLPITDLGFHYPEEKKHQLCWKLISKDLKDLIKWDPEEDARANHTVSGQEDPEWRQGIVAVRCEAYLPRILPPPLLRTAMEVAVALRGRSASISGQALQSVTAERRVCSSVPQSARQSGGGASSTKGGH
ncbi:hypothetical protein CBS101457_003013 [Exobasidium rhododendri]|nr:hypothetical protein CBS101457_003013 [Exobasidium rhododendri]